MGLHAAESDLVSRYHQKNLTQLRGITQQLNELNAARRACLATLLKQDDLVSSRQSVKDIFHIIKRTDPQGLKGNPLTVMMARNLKHFTKLNIHLRKELKRRQLDP